MIDPTVIVINRATELDALPDGDAAVLTSGGVLWMKGDDNMWIKPTRHNVVKVWSSEHLIRVGPLKLVYCGGEN